MPGRVISAKAIRNKVPASCRTKALVSSHALVIDNFMTALPRRSSLCWMRRTGAIAGAQIGFERLARMAGVARPHPLSGRRSPTWRRAPPRSATATARELIWLLEHPPLYTAGTSADPAELFNPEGFPVYEAGRGGRYTYHGPGQRVGYVLLDLDRRGRDVRAFVHALEGWLIADARRARRRRPPRAGADRHLDRPGRRRSQDRRARPARPPLGHAARLRGQPRARTFPLLRHRAVRYCRLSGDQPRRDGTLADQPRFDLALQQGLDVFLFSLEGEGDAEQGLRAFPFRIMCTTDLGKKGPPRPNR